MTRLLGVLALIWSNFVMSNTFLQMDIDTSNTVSVNQRVPVSITLLTDDFFTNGPQLRLPNVKHALVLQQEPNIISSFTTVKDIKYVSQTITYEVYPTQVGVVNVPSMTIVTQVQNKEISLQTNPFTLVVSRPDEMKGINDLLVSSKVDVEEQWEDTQASYEAGDIVTRTITIKADNTSNLVLPDFVPNKDSGVSVLLLSPQLSDVYGRLDSYAQMKQVVSYTIQEPGHHQLGGEVIQWWNPKTKQKEAYQLDVLNVNAGFSFSQFIKKYWLVSLLSLVFLIFVVWLARLLKNRFKAVKDFCMASGLKWLSQFYQIRTKRSVKIPLFTDLSRNQDLNSSVMDTLFREQKDVKLSQKIKMLMYSKKVDGNTK